MKVGFIGLGKMGAGICSNIVKNGIDVVVYDINPASVRKFVDMGASSAATVKELAAQVDVCITCVPMPKDAKGVLLGPDGVFENLPEGGVHFDLSTLDIETVVMLEAEAAKLGKKYLVIPMGKGPAFAADGTCPLFGGGDKATYDKYEECLLKKMGKPAYIGDVKAGCALKLIQNLMGLGPSSASLVPRIAAGVIFPPCLYIQGRLCMRLYLGSLLTWPMLRSDLCHRPEP